MNTAKPLSADRPLDDPATDRLGYATFAKHLAGTILNSSPSDGLVVAVHGDWGTGKTTALKFIVHYLELQEEPPIVMWFNPWWFAGQEDLIRRFFKELQATVASSSKLLRDIARRDRLAAALNLFGSALSSPITIPSVPLAGTAAKMTSEGVKALAAVLAPTDVVTAKARISSAFKEQVARIVVIVDDIDRLMASEARQIFQLIKAVADFPNVTYLLAFDRKVAARAMADLHGSDGDEYLEKNCPGIVLPAAPRPCRDAKPAVRAAERNSRADATRVG